MGNSGGVLLYLGGMRALKKYSNKALQTDNLRAVCLVVSLSLNGTTRQTAHKLRLTAALSEKSKPDMIKHYLVPVIELPLSLKEWERLGGIFKFEKLSGTHEHCRQAWLSYWETNDVLLDDRSLPEWLVGNCVFPTSEVSECFIGPVVESHCQEYNIDEVSSLFGGYALFANQEPILVPQCCGTLGDIHSWEKLLRDEEYDECFCLEGHPSPEAKTQGSTIVFNCDNEYEEFIGPVAKDLSLIHI